MIFSNSAILVIYENLKLFFKNKVYFFKIIGIIWQGTENQLEGTPSGPIWDNLNYNNGSNSL